MSACLTDVDYNEIFELDVMLQLFACSVLACHPRRNVLTGTDSHDGKSLTISKEKSHLEQKLNR